MEEVAANYEPTAMALVGDSSLNHTFAGNLLQQAQGEVDVWNRNWHFQHSFAGRGGDIIFFKGSQCTRIDISIGMDYADKGIRCDGHDCFGVSLEMRVGQQPHD